VHLQSGHGLDDVALAQAGARSVIGIDYSQVAVRTAQCRADELGVACRYAVAVVPAVPLASASADLVYTGKGALICRPARPPGRMTDPQHRLAGCEPMSLK
jgi:ubiquinone/menaquinone biosynthesis C-methylase UbiE